ncbi:MAG: polysaccharide deacetylase [Oscillospiraceae bacterium]|nr:polysaccharide deacetylase [Oscillospiraceae bacterium]
MYWGSVRFFKHLILSTVALMILVPTVLAVVFGIQNHRNKQLVEELKKYSSESQLPKMEYLVGVDYSEVITVPTFTYQEDYPDMYVERSSFVAENSEKPVVYLTFDDGPSANTEKVLDILKANDIKATFFVVNSNIEAHQYLYKRIVDEGHTLGIHTYSHQYKKIYNSVDDYLADFNQIFNKVYELTGVKPTVFRFPGGSINVYNHQIYFELISEMLRRGFVYYDWNVSSGDAGQTFTSAAIHQAVVNGAINKDKSVVLMHDSSTKAATVGALQSIIDSLKETHEFRPITNSVEPTVFTYEDNKR